MALETVYEAGDTIKVDQWTIEVAAGHWLNARHGTVQAPTDDLLAQVPAGKKWTVCMTVQVVETDA